MAASADLGMKSTTSQTSRQNYLSGGMYFHFETKKVAEAVAT